MAVEIACPQNCYSGVMAGISKRKGLVTNTETRGDLFFMTADVPLREMFGYASELRGLTSGEGEFSMEYKKHFPMNPSDAKEAIEKFKLKRREKD
jgi:elongation factor G